MKHTLLVGLLLTAVSTAHSMHQGKTQKNTQPKTQKSSQKSIQKNQEIHNLFKEGKHKEAEKKLPSKKASLVLYSQTTNDPQFKLWVDARTK